ncbi:Ras and EF-hand domain-containing protein-like [Exaiptasia diaphana]|nr:Ras and EF-hand domain-containing protein-like [Exaiptasia diaphana]
MSEVLQPEDTLKERATELFSLCDQNRNGFITQGDLVQVITQLGLPLEQKQVEQAFTKLDNDHNGYLTLDEFIEGFGLFLGIDVNDLNENDNELEEIANTDPGRELFYLCDTDRKGYITKTDLQRVSYDLNLNFDQLDLIFDKLDQDGNGRLTLDEFAEGFGAFLRGGDEPEDSHIVQDAGGIEVEAFDQPRDVFESASAEDTSSISKEDAVFREVVESIGEDVLSGALTKDQLRELWISLQNNDSRAINKFEDFLAKVSTEIKRARNDSIQLENALKSKMNSHDREVQKLYEEMEQQIKAVRDRYETEQEKRERAIKGELMSELERKEMEIQWMLNKQKKLEETIADNEKRQQEIKVENELLLQKNISLEDQLTDSVISLEDTRNYVQHLQTITAEEKEERARHALKMTQGMQLEQESLIQQLDLLRDVNQKLRDDRDSIEAAHKAKRERGHSLSDELEEAEKHKKVNRQGSKMSKYFDRSSRNQSSVDWGKQGAIESIDENVNSLNELDKQKMLKNEQRFTNNNYFFPSVEERSSEDEHGNSSDAVFSSEEYSGSDYGGRPRSPRTAPIGKDDEALQAEAASTTSLEPAKPATPVRVFKVVIVGVDFQIKTMVVDDRCIAIQLWDTAGQERFRSITKQYFRKADGILIFYDVTAESSYINLKSWMTSVEVEEAEEKAALMVIGNKLDLSEDSSTRVVSRLEAESLAKVHNALYMETSAKTGYNINEAMVKLAEVLQEREDEMMNSVLNLVNLTPVKKKRCCKSS